MFPLDDAQLVAFQRQLEHRDPPVLHELRSHWPADQAGEFLCAAGDVLFSLRWTMVIITALGLYRHNILPTVFVDADIDFVDLDLPHVLDRGACQVPAGCKPA